jgi:hypothetical protein
MKHMARNAAVAIVTAVIAWVHGAPAAQATHGYPHHHYYLGNYPDERENGWSQEAQGVAHDASNWFFTQRDRLLKFPVWFDINRGIDRLHPPFGVISRPIPSALTSRGYDHFGDPDQSGGFVFVPLEGPGIRPAIAAFRASDLTLVSFVTVNQAKAGWVAYNAAQGLLYTSNSDVTPDAGDPAGGPLFRYTLNIQTLRDTARMDLALHLHSRFSVFNPWGGRLTLRVMQGGVFGARGQLYLVNGDADHDLDGGIRVFTANGLYITRSTNGYGEFNYEFHPGWSRYEEPEGIDYWDRDYGTVSPGIRGQLHVVMLDNDSGTDDLYVKHYRVTY